MAETLGDRPGAGVLTMTWGRGTAKLSLLTK